MNKPIALTSIRPCLEGIIPAALASCAADGTPNVTYVSHVHYVDAEHVALSFQFFNKTRENVLSNPRVLVQLIHPDTGQSYRLTLRYLRTESEGPLFEAMKARLAGIASHTGMAKVFRLLGADVYRVVRIDAVPGLALPVVGPPSYRLEALRLIGAQMQRATDLSELTQGVLDGLAQRLDMHNSLVLMLDPARKALYTVASRGYANSGVGAEIALGQGVIGVAAAQRTPIRIGYYTQDSAYSQAVRDRLESSERSALELEIPLPGLPQSRSQLAVPICLSGRLLGVLFVESDQNLRFDAADEDALVVLAQQIGLAIALLQQQTEETADEAEPVPYEATHGAAEPIVVRHFPVNDSVFLDDSYLIKGVAGAIFMRLVRDYLREGRTRFSNKELRLDPSLGLPDITDNLEARLILLDRRLSEQRHGVWIEKTGRGRFRLVVQRPLRLASAGADSG
jgi:GAF domain-containing protein